MPDDEQKAFLDQNWPILLAACCALILWYTLGDNIYAGAAGFLGLGWLGWERLIKPRL